MRLRPTLLHRRALALALAGWLLLAQLVGVQHLWSHLQAPAGTAAAQALAAAAPAPSVDDPAGEGLCRLCLGLAALGLALLPTLPRWALPRALPAPPAPWPLPPLRAGAASPFRARAPPATVLR